jgi:hypothetical protein
MLPVLLGAGIFCLAAVAGFATALHALLTGHQNESAGPSG